MCVLCGAIDGGCGQRPSRIADQGEGLWISAPPIRIIAALELSIPLVKVINASSIFLAQVRLLLGKQGCFVLTRQSRQL